MIVEASIIGVFRTILILIGALVVIRFIGQLMQAKNAMEEERKMNADRRKSQDEYDRVRKNFGRTTISRPTSNSANIEDVEFEEID